MGRQLFFVLMIFAVSVGAQALTGSGESGAGALETVSPSLQSVSAVTERSLSATFSEAMLLPGITTPENYAVSGLGAGTLAATPDGVTGGGPYALTWTAGEMRNGASVTVTATGVQDAVGNPINPAHTVASASGMGVAPLFSGLSVTPAQASAGVTVTITFTASETLDGDPVVTVNGHDATWISGAKAVDYVYEYEVQPTDSLGTAALSVTGSDLAGNTGGLNDSALLEIVGAEPGLPLYAWPLGLVLLATGLLLLRGLRKSPLGGGARGMFLLLALFIVPALVCSTAFAQAPTVSNVTFTQSPTATGTQVDIHYDLLAPNGPCAITVWLSKDGGTDGYSSPVTSVTGDLTNVTTGTGKHIVWDIRADYAEEDIPNARIRITADDGLVQHAIGVTSGGNGAVGGGGTYNHGATVTLSATPDAGYHFVNWTEGGTPVSTDPAYSFTATSARTLVGNFAINTYDITCTVVGNGTCVANPVTVNHGDTSDITFAPDPGWYLLSVVDSVEGVKCEPYTTTPVTEDRTVTATFTSDHVIMLPGCVPLELVWVPSGSYQMGRYAGEADSFAFEDPQHPVTLTYGFWMGKYEITQEQWLAVMGSWPGTAPSSTYGLGNTYPAYFISWNDTKDFITSLNAHIVSSGQGPLTVRLPNEAEWEYACRAGTTTRFYWGDDSGYTQIGTHAWFFGNNSPNGTKPVGGKTGNAFELYDMNGNVYEWCEDDFHLSYTGAPADGSAWIDSPRASDRTVRGGGWDSYAWYCRSALRNYSAPSDRGNNLGFRLAAVQPVPPEVTSFDMNGGSATTTDPAVTLNNTATNSPTEYMASEASDFSGASWQAYGTAPSFTLSEGAGGVKTVYFKVRNGAGESGVVSDTISLSERTIQLPGSVPLVLRWVPSGSFQMGRYAGEVAGIANEDPQHPVTLAYGFWMGKYEVTQQQWIAVRSTWPSTAPSVAYGLGNTYPAYYISWNNAKDFITTLNAHIVSSGQGPLTVRLPNEAEWEYACRGGTQTRFYWGDDSGYTQIGAYAWYNGNNSPNGSKAVSGKMGNAFGLYDMIGNIGEWCEDDYHGSYTGAPNDGSPWIDSPRASYRLIRGGYWDYLAMHCRSAFRGYSGPGSPDFAIGFRLAAVE